MISRKVHLIISVSIILSCFFIQSYFSEKLKTIQTAFVEMPRQYRNVWTPQLFKALTFGQWPTAIDWTWVKVLQDTAIDHVRDGETAPVFYALDLITGVDPAQYEPYFHGANLLTVIRNDRESALKILNKAKLFLEKDIHQYPKYFHIDHWGDSWKIYMLLGYTYLFEFDDLVQSAISFREASHYPNAPAFIVRLGLKLKTKRGVYEVGLQLLDFLIKGKEGKVKSKLQKKRDLLFHHYFIFRLNEDYEIFSKGKATNKNFKEFLKKRNFSGRDPMGGYLSLSKSGKIESSISVKNILNMDHLEKLIWKK